MKKSKILFFASFALAITGVFLLSFYLTNIITFMIRYNSYNQIQGKIVGYTIGDDGKKAKVINYEVNETNYQVLSTFSNEEPEQIGYSILVRYDKEHPNMYILGDEQLPFIKVTAGLVLAIVGISGMTLNYKGSKRKNEVIEEQKGE